MSTYTSRSRFDESRRFTGVYQQMGRVAVDADWNEEVTLQVTDARRRTADIAEGALGDGFQISEEFVLDTVVSASGWTGTPLDQSDLRYIPPELSLGRYDLASLPFVIRSRGNVALRRMLPAGQIIDVTAVQVPSVAGPPFAVSKSVVLPVRFDVPPNEVDDLSAFRLLIITPGGEVQFNPGPNGTPPSDWTEVSLPTSALAALNITQIIGWGVIGLPPLATTWIGSLRGDAGFSSPDFVIRGGDGTLAGAGRIFAGGVRAFQLADLRFSAQPDYPLAQIPIPQGGAGGHGYIYLDLWEQPITALDDAFLVEPALDGLDTTTRRRLVQQVKVAWIPDGTPEGPPAPLGGGALTTSFADNDGRPLRYPPDPFDVCRDRCLNTASTATGKGYRGTDNVHVRVEVVSVNARSAAVWSRDNGSTVALLTQGTIVGAMTLIIDPEAALSFQAGDLVVIESKVTRLRPDDTTTGALVRRLKGVDASTGILELEDVNATTGIQADPFPVGGPLPVALDLANSPAVRRWDSVDWIAVGQIYNLRDGIDLAFSGAPADYRPGDYWSFTARILDADGESRGVVEPLVEARPHGIFHRYVPLARVLFQSGHPLFVDIRPRYLPLEQVRDRLIELEQELHRSGPFTIVIGDGVNSHGDLDQDIVHGIAGDEVIQLALSRLTTVGGTIYIRRGTYTFERPVLMQSLGKIRLIGDGDSTVINASGVGGAFLLDNCGKVNNDISFTSFEHLRINDNPSLQTVYPAGSGPLPGAPTGSPLAPADLLDPSQGGGTLHQLGVVLKNLQQGQGRAMTSILATLEQLRYLQKTHPGMALANVPGAADLLQVMQSLPHGSITISDSVAVTIEDCIISNQDPAPIAACVFITGSCTLIRVLRSFLAGTVGVLASPLAGYLSDSYLAQNPGASMSLNIVEIAGNTLFQDQGHAFGVHIGDGFLNGVTISDNTFGKAAVGIGIDNLTEIPSDDPHTRVLISRNRLTHTNAIGILAAGDGIDISDNEIGASTGTNDLFQGSGLYYAGIQVSGQRVRVRDCWVELPAVTNAPALGVFAGIVVGDGLDDGLGSDRPVFDVEISGNRIEGAGASTPATGVLIGGPQPIYDVRVRGNVIKNLGDAGVRVLGVGVAAGRLRIEDNRIEQVALAEPPLADTNVKNEINLLSADLGTALYAGNPNRDLSRVEDLLSAVVQLSTPAKRTGLDGALRWLEQLTLRGGVVLSHVEGVEVTGNRITGVGRYQALTALRPLPAEIRTGAVAVVGGHDVVIENNHLEEVRAPVATLSPSSVVGLTIKPLAVGALKTLLVTAIQEHPAEPDIHLVALGFYAILGVYGVTTDLDSRTLTRAKLALPLEAFEEKLESRGEGDLAAGMSGLIDRFNKGETTLNNTAGDGLRLFFAHVANLTAAPEETNTWKALFEIEGAISEGSITKLRGAGTAVTNDGSFFDSVPSSLSTPINNTLLAITAITGTDIGRTLVNELVPVAILRYEQANKIGVDGLDTFGYRREIVATLTQALTKKAQDSLTSTPPTITELRSDVKGLTQVLREAGSDLAAHVGAKFLSVDQATPAFTTSAIQPFIDTLNRVASWAAGQSSDPASQDAAGLALVDLGQTQGQIAIALLAAEFVDAQVAQLGSLAEASVDLSAVSLSGIGDKLAQLQLFVSFAGDLHDLVQVAIAAETFASGNANEGITNSNLLPISDALQRLITVIGEYVKTSTADIATGPTDQTPQRTAGLGALILSIPDLLSASVDDRTEAIDLLAQHVGRGLEETGAKNTERGAVQSAVQTAANTLLGATTPTSDQVAPLLFELSQHVETIASAAAAVSDTPPMLASAALLTATRLGLDPAGTDSDRVSRVKTYLGTRKADVSAAVVDQLTQAADLPTLMQGLRGGFERLSVAEAPQLELAATIQPVFTMSPEPSDGIFAAGIVNRLRVAGNTVLSAVVGVSILGAPGHLFAEPVAGAQLSADVLNNQVRACAVGGLDVITSGAAIVTVAGNHFAECADLGTSADILGRGGAVAPFPAFGQAVTRFSGSGDLVIQANVFHDNGHGHPNALVHEILADWRGDVVLRGNTIRHGGGGAGGAAILLVVETLDADATKAGQLVTKLSRSAALAIEPPPSKPSAVVQLTRSPWRALSMVGAPVSKPLNTSVYLSRVVMAPAVTVADFLRLAPVMMATYVLPQRRAVHLEGNHVHAAGPALLLLAAGTDVISATVLGNELRSEGTIGAVYLRHTDATIFSANACDCPRSVNVVVMRPDMAPVSVTGNIILGAQPVTQTYDKISAARADLKTLANVQTTQPSITLFNANRAFSLNFSDQTVLQQVLTSFSTALNAKSAPKPAAPPPNVRTHSLVILGGTRVVSAGNATTAGSLVQDADDKTELNI